MQPYEHEALADLVHGMLIGGTICLTLLMLALLIGLLFF
jgi:hypothetical protein